MAILNVPITNATCTRAELEAARLLDGLVAARIYYISNEQIYELATGPNTTIQYLPTTSTPGDIGAEPAITPKGTAFNQDFGVGSGDVCEGDDARLHDDRDPTLHAASHAQGGLDELTPAAIGAATAADVVGKVAKAGDTMTGDLNLTSAKVLITDGGVRSVHSPFDYNDPSSGVGGFGLEDAGDASTTGGMVLMTNPATGTEEVTVGSVDGSTGLRLRAPHVVVDSQSVAVALEAAEAGSSIIVTGFTQTGEAILGAVQPPGTAYEEMQIDTRNLSLGTGDGTGAWVDVVVLDALTQECQDNLTQIIYQMYMANSSTAETKVEVGYRIDGADPTEWRLHDLGTSSSGVSISDVFQPTSNLLLGQVLTLTARRVGSHVDSTALIQGSAIDASSFKVRVIQAAVSTGEANRGFALASPNVYHSMDGFNLQFRGMADTGDIEWSTPGANTLGADLTTQAGVTPGTYTYPTIQVDAKGRVVTISNQIGGGLDHGALGGLGDDDHTQYHNDARGDLRYSFLAHALAHSQGAADELTPANIGAEPEITPKGTAFNKDFGTGADTVCEGDDSRLTDTRVPEDHAASHHTGGGDELTPADIGAEPAITKNTAFNKDFGAVADTVCEGDDARLGLAASALQSVEDDPAPVLGGHLTIGGPSAYDIAYTDQSGTVQGVTGTLSTEDAVFFAKTDSSATYDDHDGGILAKSGGVSLHGAVVEIPALAHVDESGYQEMRVSTDGNVFAAAPAAPGWSETGTSTSDATAATDGNWVQVPGLSIVLPQDVAPTDLINTTAKLYLSNGNKPEEVGLGIGVNSAEPVTSGQAAALVKDFEGYITFGFSSASHGGGTSGQSLQVWIRAITGQSAVDALGTTQEHSLLVSVPGGGGSGGLATNITVTLGPTSAQIDSSTGAGDAIPAAVAGGSAGVLSGTDKQKLDGLSAQVWTTPRVSVNGNGNTWPFTPDGQTYDYHPDPLYSSISFAVVPPANQDTIDSTSIVDFHAPDAGSWTFTVAAGDLLNGFVPPVINAGDPPVSVVVRYLPGEISAQLSYLDSTDPSAFGGSVNADRDGSGATTGTYAWDVTDDPGGFVVVPTGVMTFDAPTNPPTLQSNAVHEFVLTVTFDASAHVWNAAWINPPVPNPDAGRYHIAGVYDGTNYTLGVPVRAEV